MVYVITGKLLCVFQYLSLNGVFLNVEVLMILYYSLKCTPKKNYIDHMVTTL